MNPEREQQWHVAVSELIRMRAGRRYKFYTVAYLHDRGCPCRRGTKPLGACTCPDPWIEFNDKRYSLSADGQLQTIPDGLMR